MTQILLFVYIVLFLAIIYISWNYIFNTPAEDNAENSDSLNNTFKGKKVVFDGKLDETKERIIKNELLEHKAIIESKMTEDTQLLITGRNPDWLVVDEAKDCGAMIVNEADWKKMKQLQQTKLSNNARILKKRQQVDSSAEII